jgi:hypothetical protein
MAYYIQKPSRIDENIIVYYTGNGKWSDDASQKALFTTKTAATNLMKNPDGKNGGWTGATIVSNK